MSSYATTLFSICISMCFYVFLCLALQLSVKRFAWDDMAKKAYGEGCLFVERNEELEILKSIL